MKRIAIELYGLLRSYKTTFDSFFINVLQPLYSHNYLVDIFIHTWNESDSNDTTWHNPKGEKRGCAINEAEIEDIVEKYRPKMITVDEPLNIGKDVIIQEKLYKNTRSYNSLLSCFCSRYKVNELRKKYEKENNIKYDCVILTRFDIYFNKPFYHEFYYKTYNDICDTPIDKNAIFSAYTPFRGCAFIENDNLECCGDLIVYSTPESIDKITYFYQDLQNGVIDEKFINENSYTIESLWRKYWKLNKLEYYKIKYAEHSDYTIIRAKNNKSQKLEGGTKKIKNELQTNLGELKQYFKPVFSWISQIFSIFYYVLKILLKSLKRIIRCI